MQKNPNCRVKKGVGRGRGYEEGGERRTVRERRKSEYREGKGRRRKGAREKRRGVRRENGREREKNGKNLCKGERGERKRGKWVKRGKV